MGHACTARTLSHARLFETHSHTSLTHSLTHSLARTHTLTHTTLPCSSATSAISVLQQILWSDADLQFANQFLETFAASVTAQDGANLAHMVKLNQAVVTLNNPFSQ